jgi:glutathione synthase/RimK-type ligase-like ATP-grasp enzyme
VGENNIDNMNMACKKLVKLMLVHLGINDFSSDVIMKDKFGSGGNGIYKFKIDKRIEMQNVAKKHPKISYIIQPFAKFDTGFLFKDNLESADIRLIFLGGKIVQSYIRVAKTGDFRCNEHQGGLLTYLNLSEIPIDVVNKAYQVAEILNKKCSLYTLDFIVSNSGNAYLLEGNTNPGLDWNENLPKNEIEAKKLINLVVEELKNRVRLNN